ncbi:MAG: sn-glycerol-3-phosphate ABC transporter ATP-binding protein UgpC [Candidatus Latescibacteria bacterium]|nr:sn-glycerol-3-phosphate ABC transporter ATP-binding protein UgpC [Candidatus Latescibacterota bacterium]
MAEVALKNVTKVFDKHVVAVKDVNLEVAEAEFVVLVGPSGCGKSTTLRMVAGLEEVTSGEIYIDGRLVNDVPPKDRDIAMVFQNYALYPHMTVYQNMAFGLKLRKYPKEEIDHRVQEAAEILGIQDLLDRRPKALSGGQRQRVAVGRAIVRKPKVFLFDEPLSNLDAKLRVQMRTEISKLHSRLGATMIYVTHDQVEAMTMGDRIVVMKDGIIQQIDTPLNLYNRPTNRFVAGFIGSPSMNFLEGTFLQNKDNGLIFDEGSVTITISQRYEEQLHHHVGKRVIFGIRPEDIFDPRLSEGAEEKAHIRARVEVVEPMGNETLVYLSTNTSSLVARLDAMRLPKVGEEMALVLDISRSHFFDSETEEALL